jgi:hypothetical protein
MIRWLVAAALTMSLTPGLSYAIEITNIRPCYGPFGAKRVGDTWLPGDVVFMAYDIEGLTPDTKTGLVKYTTTLEFVDPAGKILFSKPTPNEFIPALGGNKVPGDLHVFLATKQAPGKYEIRLTVEDEIGKNAKRFIYKFDVAKETFGFAGVSAPSVGFPGQHYSTQFGLVNLQLDKMGMPSAEVTVRVLDDKTRTLVGGAVKMVFPRDLPLDIDLKEANFLPLKNPIYLNRPGRFIVEITATDKLAGSPPVVLSYPITVFDVSAISSQK